MPARKKLRDRGGQPTKYSPKMLEKARHYIENFDQPPYNNKVPTVFRLVSVLKVSRATIYNWRDPEFLDTLDELNSKQAEVLCDKGLSNEFNSTIAKLMLANQGMSDKITQEHTGPGGKELNLKVDWVTPKKPSES